MDMDKTIFKAYAKLILTTKLNQNIDENVNIYKKLKERQGCGKTFNSVILFNDHIRDDDDCSIYYKLDYLTYKVCPNQGCNTIWKTYKDLEKHLEYHCHQSEKEKGKYPPIMIMCR